MKINKISLLFGFLCSLTFQIKLLAQPFIFFSDSPNNDYYESSWGFSNPPSFVQLRGADNNKFPVTTEFAFNSLNSLLLDWRSMSGGDWALALAEMGWPGHDITTKDSLILYVYSESEIPGEYLPKIFLEDLSNNRTEKHNLGDFISSLKPQQWQKISISLSVFMNNPGSADVSSIKTIFFGQNGDEGLNHKIYIDNVRMLSSSGTDDQTPPHIPQNVEAKGFDLHIDIIWDFNEDEDIESYSIFRKEDSNYVLIGTAGKYDRFFTDFVNQHGVTNSYRVSAVDENLNSSDLSAEVTATTRELNDDEFMDMVQEATFRYFWDYADNVSGLSRERYRRDAGKTVTTGGSGFGIMAILVGIERGFITREEGAERILKISNFLKDKADRFNGVWSHWLDGETGAALPFSQYDDGGDIVETSFLIQGLLTARKYFNKPSAVELQLTQVITELWETVDWNFYRKFDHSPYLYWHWSPNHGWIMDFRIIGYMESLITYILAVASPTNGIPAWCYEQGWVDSKDRYTNGSSYYGYKLYVGHNYGGPLFFAHYSFIGFDPRFVRDNYANYFLHNKNQTLINRAYCIENPNGFVGYDEDTWGLTASDNPWGYSAQAPNTNDNGTITPTAAISSMPYTPVESISAMKNMYRNYGKDLWDIYGFKDAFNPTENWFAESYIAIDQGPIICMIENHRTQLLWNYFMQNEEIQPALDSIGFVEDITDYDDMELTNTEFELHQNYPNPFNPTTTIKYSIPNESADGDKQKTSAPQSAEKNRFIPSTSTSLSINSVEGNFVRLTVHDILGREIETLVNERQKPGNYSVQFDISKLNNSLSSGVYFYSLKIGEYYKTKKMILMK